MPDEFPMKQISTGQSFPDGIDLHEHRCHQCGREGQVALIRVRFFRTTFPDVDLCAECIADFVASPGVEVYGQRNGDFYQLIWKPRVKS